jgi:hypothetical protein
VSRLLVTVRVQTGSWLQPARGNHSEYLGQFIAHRLPLNSRIVAPLHNPPYFIHWLPSPFSLLNGKDFDLYPFPENSFCFHHKKYLERFGPVQKKILVHLILSVQIFRDIYILRWNHITIRNTFQF